MVSPDGIATWAKPRRLLREQALNASIVTVDIGLWPLSMP
jgi:hypothetical protein